MPTLHREFFEIMGDLIDECNEALSNMEGSPEAAAKLSEAVNRAIKRRAAMVSEFPREKGRIIRVLICNFISDGDYTRAQITEAIEKVFASTSHEQINLMVNSFINDLLSPERAKNVNGDTEFAGKVAKIDPSHGYVVWKA